MKPILPLLALCLSACNRSLPEGSCETADDCSSGICDGEACVVVQTTSCVDAAPEGASSDVVDVEIFFNEADGWDTPADCAWSCDADYAQEGEACIQSKMVACTDAAPANSTSVAADVEITYTDAGGWTAPAECAWSCDADFVDESGVCIQSKTVACADVAPANGTSVAADVEITYTDAGGWTAPAECAWSCDTDFVDESGVCIQSKQVACTDAAPLNATSVVADVQIDYTTAGGWTAPAECAWSCDTDFVDENGVCIQSKQVACTDAAPLNATSVVADVQIDYTTAGGWTAPAECAWSCDTDFVDENGVCIQSKQVACTDAAPLNATSVVADVQIDYTTAGGWTAPAECAWSCDTDFVDENGVCIQSKTVACADVAPANATSVVADVQIDYTTAGGWTAPAECAWSCDTDFVEEFGACYLGVTALLPGDLVITEIHANPAFDPTGLACTDARGEYVELYNNTGVDIALKGLTIEDGGAAPTSHAGGVVVAAGDYAVIGRSADCNAIGLDGTFDFGLNNTGDVVTIGNGLQVIDTVDFTSWSQTSLLGASFSLAPDLIDADLNDFSDAWCASSAPIPNGLADGIGDLGSPGVQNPTCDRAGTSSIDAASSCKAIYDGGFSTGDGLYWLDLTGWTGEDAFEATCDMTNGGWTQVVRILGNSVAHADQPAALNNWADPTQVAKFSDADINALNTVGYWRYHCGNTFNAYVQNVENTWTSAKSNTLQWSVDRGLDQVFECAGNRDGYVFSDFFACPTGHSNYASLNGPSEGYGCYVDRVGWNLPGSLWAK